jgi:hypothetical protein
MFCKNVCVPGKSSVEMKSKVFDITLLCKLLLLSIPLLVTVYQITTYHIYIYIYIYETLMKNVELMKIECSSHITWPYRQCKIFYLKYLFIKPKNHDRLEI